MGVQTLLLLAGAVAATAAIVTTAVLSYRFSVRRRQAASIRMMLDDSVISTAADLSDSHKLEGAGNIDIPRKNVSEATNLRQISAGLAPVPEAPAPFPEDIISPSQTAIPTDTTAVANMTSPAQGMPQVLVIARPKRRVRSVKRLPTGDVAVTPRGRPSTRGKSLVLDGSLVAVAQSADPGQQKN